MKTGQIIETQKQKTTEEKRKKNATNKETAANQIGTWVGPSSDLLQRRRICPPAPIRENPTCRSLRQAVEASHREVRASERVGRPVLGLQQTRFWNLL